MAEFDVPDHRLSFSSQLGPQGISTTTYPYGPNWSTVKPYNPAPFAAPINTLPSDLCTTRRLQYSRPASAFDAKTLRYPNTYVPPPQEPAKRKINLKVKFMGGGMDGTIVPVAVRSTGTVAELITTSVEALRQTQGSTVSYNNLRVTGLFSEAGRPLSAGYRLHSQGQVPQVKEGSTMVLKVMA